MEDWREERAREIHNKRMAIYNRFAMKPLEHKEPNGKVLQWEPEEVMLLNLLRKGTMMA